MIVGFYCNSCGYKFTEFDYYDDDIEDIDVSDTACPYCHTTMLIVPKGGIPID